MGHEVGADISNFCDDFCGGQRISRWLHGELECRMSNVVQSVDMEATW